MYRSQKTSSKLCTNRVRERAYELHMKKLRNMKPSVSTKPPKKHPHLKRNLKKLQMEEEKYNKIKYENQLLMNKMMDIMEKKYIDNENKNMQYVGKSLNSGARRREMERITEENKQILKRITQKQPVYDHTKWELERQKNLQYAKNIAEYPLQTDPSLYEEGYEYDDRRSSFSPNRSPKGKRSTFSQSQEFPGSTNDQSQGDDLNLDESQDFVDMTNGFPPSFSLLCVGARNLKGDTIDNLCDPIAHIRLVTKDGDETATFSTEPSASSSPTWDENFSFSDVNPDDRIEITITDDATSEKLSSCVVTWNQLQSNDEVSINLNPSGFVILKLM